MKLTPLDIRQKRFDVVLRGYSRKEVEGFLEFTAKEYEETVREKNFLADELKRTCERLELHIEREKTLQATMVTAQRMSDELKEQAHKAARVIIADAELQAEKIVAGANSRLVELVRDLNELKRQKTQFEVQMTAVIDWHKKLLESFSGSEQGDVAFFVKKANE